MLKRIITPAVISLILVSVIASFALFGHQAPAGSTFGGVAGGDSSPRAVAAGAIRSGTKLAQRVQRSLAEPDDGRHDEDHHGEHDDDDGHGGDGEHDDDD